MKSECRACVSYLAGRLILGRDAMTIYGCLEGVRHDVPDLLERNQAALIEAKPPFGRPLRFDETGERSVLYNTFSGEIYMNISGNTFKGYEAGSSTLFAGKASGNLVVIFDYREKTFFKYRLCGGPKTKKGGGIDCGEICRDCAVGKLHT